jgi:hypothetical protein
MRANTMLDLGYDCRGCGRRHQVKASQAGASLDCGCGFKNRLPPLSDLRRHAGLSAYEPTAAQSIGQAIREGVIPGDTTCAECRRSDAQKRTLVAVCELGGANAYGTDGKIGKLIVGTIAGIPFAFPIGPGTRGEFKEISPGRNVSVPLPVHICDHCWRDVHNSLATRFFRLLQRVFLMGAALLLVGWVFSPTMQIANAVLVCLCLTLACALMAWFVRAWFQRKDETALKSLLRNTEPLYAKLLSDYPDASLECQ